MLDNVNIKCIGWYIHFFRKMSYSKIVLTQNNDYIAVRASARFEINFTNNSDFGGAKIKVYKTFTKKNAEIGFADITDKLDGNDTHIEHTKAGDQTFNAASDSTWYIFEVSDATLTTNIVVTINHNFPNTGADTLAARNIQTNIALIEQV